PMIAPCITAPPSLRQGRQRGQRRELGDLPHLTRHRRERKSPTRQHDRRIDEDIAHRLCDTLRWQHGAERVTDGEKRENAERGRQQHVAEVALRSCVERPYAE